MTETREATLVSIAWQKPGNSWKRLRMDDGEAWTGNFGDVTPGMLLRVEGDEETHPRYGRSFKVTRVIAKTLSTVDGMKAWLVYRLPEIGEARADALLDRFGEDLGPTIEENPQALAAVPGITAARAQEIADVYLAHQDEQRLVSDLVGHGLGMGLSLKAYNHFESELDAVLARDVYELMDVAGITFELIDPVALDMGYAGDDPRRVAAMGLSKLEGELKQGHCYMAKLDLMLMLVKATGLKMEAVGDILYASTRITVREREVLLRRIDAAEKLVTQKALELVGREALPAADVELPDWLDPSQRAAAQALITGHLGVLTGGPGTGKTTTLQAALEAIEAGGARIKLAAPTGKAAKRMTEVTGRPASTIHKLLEWSPEGFKRNSGNPIEAEVVVIDETSMVEIELCRDLFDALGDARLILVGDVDQLPPVGPGQPLQDVIASGIVPVHRLTTTHRQAGDSWVIDNAAKIRDGVEPALTGGGFEFARHEDSDGIVAGVIELYRRVPTIQVLTPEHKNGAGTVRLNLAVQKAMNPKGDFDMFLQAGGYKIYEGDRVLYTRNVKELGLVNGELGVVRRVFDRDDKVFAAVEFEGKEHPDHPEGFYELSGSEAAPLTLAYAMTVHKSQGSEWAHVVVIADQAHWSLARRLFYTAVTRTSDQLTVMGCEAAISRAVKSNRNLTRRTLLRERLVATPEAS
jgi:exodeoxyribonuclease V alpha subunit